jgi:hypothetical protein
LQQRGKAASLVDYPSRVQVGMTGTLRGRGFRVLGRVRYTYDSGFWEEWQITWDDSAPPDWLEEDEGNWLLYRKERVKSAIKPWAEVSVGNTLKVNDYDVFVTEKREGQMAGFQGQFSSVLPLEGKFGYFTGAADDKIVSINYWEDEIELSIGEELNWNEVTIDGA